MKDFQTEITKEVSGFADLHKGAYKLIFEKISTYSYTNYTQDYYDFEDFKRKLCDVYYEEAINEFKNNGDPILKKQIVDVADISYNRRYDVLVRLDDPETFDLVLKYAEDFLKGEDFLFFQQKYVNVGALFALAATYDNPKYMPTVRSFFEGAFEFAKKYAQSHDKHGLSTSGDPDGSTLLGIAQAIASLQQQDRKVFARLIFDMYIFSIREERSYEMHQASGFMALLLTLYNVPFDLKILNDAITTTGKNYKGNVFVHQTLYAKWYMEKNGPAALAYLQDPVNKKWPTYAICALADILYKDALPVLTHRQKEEKDAVLWEVYEEAIHRLKSTENSTEDQNRMVWLNGILTPTQRALGAKSDNIFMKRAQAKQVVDETVCETDDE